jgi:ribosome-binding protein aMBF1 (putative translation factor)
MEKAISSPQYQNLISWLAEARANRAWSMRDLAERLDVPHSFIQNVENLDRRLDVYEYVVYCRALGVNPSAGLRFFAEPVQNKK